MAILCGALCVVGAGCGGKPQDVAAVLAEATARLERGDAAGAEKVYAKAMANPGLADGRGKLFGGWLKVLAGHGRLEEAQQLYHDVAPGNPTLAAAGFDVLARHMASLQEWGGLAAWMEALLDEPLPPEMLERVCLVHLEASLRHGDLGPAIQLMPRVMQRLPPASARHVFGMLRQMLFSSQSRTALDGFLATLRKEVGDNPDWKSFILLSALSLDVFDAGWDDAEARFAELAERDDETAARDGLAMLLQGFFGAGEEARLDARCAQVLEAYPRKPLLLMEAAYRWLQQARRAGGPAVIVMRLQRIADSAVPADFVLKMYGDCLYEVLGREDREPARAMVALGQALHSQLAAPGDRAGMQAMIFDAAFVAGDYALVLAQLDAGMAERDAEWHAMARNKVLAHQALENGNMAEAAARFSVFMAEIERTWTGPTADPSSGLTYSREMAMGFNARRIGDIFNKMGATNEAAVSYADARGYLDAALITLETNAAEHAFVTNQLGQLPQ